MAHFKHNLLGRKMIVSSLLLISPLVMPIVCTMAYVAPTRMMVPFLSNPKSVTMHAVADPIDETVGKPTNPKEESKENPEEKKTAESKTEAKEGAPASKEEKPQQENPSPENGGSFFDQIN